MNGSALSASARQNRARCLRNSSSIIKIPCLTKSFTRCGLRNLFRKNASRLSGLRQCPNPGRLGTINVALGLSGLLRGTAAASPLSPRLNRPGLFLLFGRGPFQCCVSAGRVIQMSMLEQRLSTLTNTSDRLKAQLQQLNELRDRVRNAELSLRRSGRENYPNERLTSEAGHERKIVLPMRYH
jgi:hypothetical protein